MDECPKDVGYEKIDPDAIAELSDVEIEDLASKLATARLKQQENVGDPFGEWERARAEILTRIKVIRQQRKVSSSGK